MSNKYNGYSPEQIQLLEKADYLEYNDSIPLYDVVISSNSIPPFAFARRGFAKYNVGDYQGAIKDFSEAILRKPNAANTIWQRAISYWKIRKYQKALDDFRDYLEIKPDDPEALYWMGKICESNSCFTDAIKYFQKALKVDPSYSEAKDALRKIKQK